MLVLQGSQQQVKVGLPYAGKSQEARKGVWLKMWKACWLVTGKKLLGKRNQCCGKETLCGMALLTRGSKSSKGMWVVWRRTLKPQESLGVHLPDTLIILGKKMFLAFFWGKDKKHCFHINVYIDIFRIQNTTHLNFQEKKNYYLILYSVNFFF